MVFNLTISLLLCLFVIKFVFSIQFQCYSNAYLILLPNAILYSNMTFQSCQCVSIEPIGFGFQYDNNNRSCYIFKNDSSRFDLRIRNNSQVCFLNRTSTSIETTTSSPTIALPYPPITVTTAIDGNTYYQREIVYLNNNVQLTSLLLNVSVTRSQNPTSPSSYTNLPNSDLNLAIAYTTDRILFTFELIPGRIISTGTHELAVQYNLNNKIQPTDNDTYQIKIDSYQDVFDHF